MYKRQASGLEEGVHDVDRLRSVAHRTHGNAGPHRLDDLGRPHRPEPATEFQELHALGRQLARDDEGVTLGTETVQAATILWAAGVAPSELNKSLGVPLDRQGRIIVEQDCSLKQHPEVRSWADFFAQQIERHTVIY